MHRMLVFLFVSYAIIYVEADVPAHIGNGVHKYFTSDGFQILNDVWKKYKLGIQHSIQTVLQDTYGDQGMNVYIRKSANSYKLSDGFLVSDNIVNVLFKDLYLNQMPRLSAPEVSFDLASNVLKVDADVGKIFIEADYLLFRNLSDVVYSSATVDPYKKSPFSLQEVKNTGEVVIIAEGCVLSGFAVTSLLGQSVHLGHDSFRISNCKFSVEISIPGAGSPPVIAPYFSPDQGADLELLLLKPMKEELVPKLQGAMFTFVNTSAIFGDNLPSIRTAQRKIFKKTLEYMAQVVTYQNQLIAKRNNGVDNLDDQIIYWTDVYHGKMQDTGVHFTNVTVSGLDSMYSAQTGGPYKMSDTNIVDTIRVGALQVVGEILLNMGNAESQYIFYGEIQDISSYVSLGLDMVSSNAQTDTSVESLRSPKKKASKKPLRSSNAEVKCIFEGWRNIELHAPNLPNHCEVCQQAPKALVTGFLLNQLPKFLTQKISESFSEAVSNTSPSEENYDSNENGGNNESSESEEGSDDVDGDGQSSVSGDGDDQNGADFSGDDRNEDGSHNQESNEDDEETVENTDDDQVQEGNDETSHEQRRDSRENVDSNSPSEGSDGGTNDEDNAQGAGTSEINQRADDDVVENKSAQVKESSHENADRRRAAQSEPFTKIPLRQFVNAHWSDNEITL